MFARERVKQRLLIQLVCLCLQAYTAYKTTIRFSYPDIFSTRHFFYTLTYPDALTVLKTLGMPSGGI